MQDGWYPFYTPKDLVIRSSGTPATLVASIRQIVQSADREQPISDVRTLSEIVEGSPAQSIRLDCVSPCCHRHSRAALLHRVTAIARDRCADRSGRPVGPYSDHGAASRDAAVGGRTVTGSGFGICGRPRHGVSVKPADTRAFMVVAGLCLVMSLVGSLLPALRAIRVDPLTAIRSE